VTARPPCPRPTAGVPPPTRCRGPRSPPRAMEPPAASGRSAPTLPHAAAAARLWPPWSSASASTELGQAAMELGHGASPKGVEYYRRPLGPSFSCPILDGLCQVQRIWPDSGDLRGGSVTVGAKTLARQRLARDLGRARFGCEMWKYVGWRNKFGGACKKKAGRRDLRCIPRVFLP
jgi:hypothetical protein